MSISKQLSQPFHTDKISFRPGATTKDKSKAIALAYIDARDVMERLDDVIGCVHWGCQYPFVGCCEISVRLADGDVTTKANCAGESAIEAEKGQASDAFKRAAVLWGIGRYLYEGPTNWYELDQYKKFTPDAMKNIKADFSRFTMEYFIDKDVLAAISSSLHEAIMNDNLEVASEIWFDLTEIEQTVMWKAETKGGYFTEQTKTIIRSLKPE